MIEEWRDIEGYEGLYQVSNLGRVKRLNYSHTGKEQILKPWIDKDGYLRVDLQKDGKRKHKRIHRLVAKAFIPNPDNLPQVNHKDENKKNNRVDNLEWCDSKYNLNYGTRNERILKKLSKPVLCVETGEIYPSAHEAGRKTGAHQTKITACCKGKYNTTKGYHWQYAENNENE